MPAFAVGGDSRWAGRSAVCRSRRGQGLRPRHAERTLTISDSQGHRPPSQGPVCERLPSIRRPGEGPCGPDGRATGRRPGPTDCSWWSSRTSSARTLSYRSRGYIAGVFSSHQLSTGFDSIPTGHMKAPLGESVPEQTSSRIAPAEIDIGSPPVRSTISTHSRKPSACPPSESTFARMSSHVSVFSSPGCNTFAVTPVPPRFQPRGAESSG